MAFDRQLALFPNNTTDPVVIRSDPQGMYPAVDSIPSFHLDSRKEIAMSEPVTQLEKDALSCLVHKHLPRVRLKPLAQRTIPRLAKDPEAIRAIKRAIREVPTRHRLWLGAVNK